MYRDRTLAGTLSRALKSFPVVLVTGPRQSGKTTLLRTRCRATHRYVSLDDPDVRERAIADPRGFLRDHPPPLILDEIQHTPSLLPYLKTIVDEDQRPGRFLLSGSQAFGLMKGVSESLAGRIAVLTLLPFSYGEASGNPGLESGLNEFLGAVLEAPNGATGSGMPLGRWLLRGGYPKVCVRRDLDHRLWAASYVQTYLERDVRAALNVGDLSTFQTFTRLAAIRTAQLLNLSDLARDAGISPPTAKAWMSVLEASHQVFLLRPYHENFGKRLIKSPKLYWTDTGIAAYLAGIRDEESALRGPMAGALFETAVVTALAKSFWHRGEPPAIWFWRSGDGLEVDLLVEWKGKLHPFEIKLNETPRPHHAESIVKWRAAAGRAAGDGLVVAPVERGSALVPGVRVLPWTRL